MKVYTTKYALTTGIEVKEVQQSGGNGEYVYTHMSLGLQQFVMGKTAFYTYEKAALAAQKMRNKKVASIQKQLNRVKGLIFPMVMPENLK